MRTNDKSPVGSGNSLTGPDTQQGAHYVTGQATRRVRSRHALPGQISLLDLGDTATAGTRRSRTAFASLFPPSTTRARWLITFGCPACGSWHHGFAESRETASGRRVAACGRTVRVKVARVYGGNDQAARRRGSAA